MSMLDFVIVLWVVMGILGGFCYIKDRAYLRGIITLGDLIWAIFFSLAGPVSLFAKLSDYTIWKRKRK